MKRRSNPPKVPKEYQSVHSKMALTKSSFTHQKGWKVTDSMLNDHMTSHTKRVLAAKTRVDSSLPTSMTSSTLWRSRNKSKPSNTRSVLLRSANDNTSGTQLGKGVDFRDLTYAESVSNSAPSQCEEFEGGQIAAFSDSNKEKMAYCSDKSPLASPYTTKTARQTVAYYDRIDLQQCEEQVDKVDPWKPSTAPRDKYKDFIGFSESSMSFDSPISSSRLNGQVALHQGRTKHSPASKHSSSIPNSSNPLKTRPHPSSKSLKIVSKPPKGTASAESNSYGSVNIAKKSEKTSSHRVPSAKHESFHSGNQNLKTPLGDTYSVPVTVTSVAYVSSSKIDSDKDSKHNLTYSQQSESPVANSVVRASNSHYLHPDTYISSDIPSRFSSPVLSQIMPSNSGVIGERDVVSEVQTTDETSSAGSVGTARVNAINKRNCDSVECDAYNDDDFEQSDEVEDKSESIGLHEESSAFETHSGVSLHNLIHTSDSQCSPFPIRPSLHTSAADSLDRHSPQAKTKTTSSLQAWQQRCSSIDRDLGSPTKEFQYLTFVAAITKDIISRGVFSNAALNMVFAEHIKRNRDKLNLEEMNKRVQELRLQLNISAT